MDQGFYRPNPHKKACTTSAGSLFTSFLAANYSASPSNTESKATIIMSLKVF